MILKCARGSLQFLPQRSACFGSSSAGLVNTFVLDQIVVLRGQYGTRSYRTINTEHWARWIKALETLPRYSSVAGVCPRVPAMIMDAFKFIANSTISLAGLPRSVTW